MTMEWPAPGFQNYVADPSELAGFESTAAYNPATNMIYVGSHNVPEVFVYVRVNSSNYASNLGIGVPLGYSNTGVAADNATIEGINAATGQMVWSHFVATVGFRGGLMTSGNVVYALTL